MYPLSLAVDLPLVVRLLRVGLPKLSLAVALPLLVEAVRSRLEDQDRSRSLLP